MFTVEQRNTPIVSNNTAMKVKSDVGGDYVKIKTNKLDIFDEDRRKLKTWLIQVKLYFKFNHVADKDKTVFATTYFRERTKH